MNKLTKKQISLYKLWDKYLDVDEKKEITKACLVRKETDKLLSKKEFNHE